MRVVARCTTPRDRPAAPLSAQPVPYEIWRWITLFTLDIRECHGQTNLTVPRTSKPSSPFSVPARDIPVGLSHHDAYDAVFLRRIANRYTRLHRLGVARHSLAQQKTARFDKFRSTV